MSRYEAEFQDYTVSDTEKKEIIDMLESLNCDSRTLDSINRNLSNAELDTGFAYSSYDKQCSIVVIHKASSIGEFINTFEHEKNHLEMHICEALVLILTQRKLHT